MKLPGELLRRCWFLAGATATGKTAAAIHLAPLIGAEILSLDSMAIYRGMDIGTAKPTVSERRMVAHYLIDLLDPDQEFSVAQYLRAAEAVCGELLQRGATPLFVGGTGLYLRSILRGVFEGPAADPEFRSRLEQWVQSTSPEELHRRLEVVDPVSAARLHPHDVRRVIRALEVLELTGRPVSDQQAEMALPAGERPPHVFWLSPPRRWLRQRIDARVDAMFAAGLLEEAQRLLNSSRGLGRTASQALGYREVAEHLSGIRSLDETVTLVKTRTRQFAKRQETWFRNLPECRAIALTGEETPAEIAELVWRTAREVGAA